MERMSATGLHVKLLFRNPKRYDVLATLSL